MLEKELLEEQFSSSRSSWKEDAEALRDSISDSTALVSY
jgi:hypothetical protein